jgi:hypothetical protein
MLMETEHHRENRSLGELFGDLTHEITTLVRQEVYLAKTEISQKATRVGRNAVYLVLGGALAYAGLLSLLAATVMGLMAAGLSGWLAALLVGMVIAGIGGGLALKGLAGIKHVDPVPQETVRTLKENEQWAKEQLK